MSKIAILAPSPIKGSGGVARIYNFAKALQLKGYQADVYVFDNGGRSAVDLCKDAYFFYSIDDLRIIAGIELTQTYDLIIATRWDTAKIVRDMPANKRAYFIQDFEACFNPVGDGTVLAENSYLYGLESITYGRWLALKLYSEFGNLPYYCNFAADLATFRVKQEMKDRMGRPPVICFIYQHDKPRRCPQLGIEALGIVKHMRPDAELYFVGSNEAPSLWYDYTNAGLLSTDGLNDLYNQCHVGLCLSSSNPSCNAFDMMAAGLPSVDLYRENNLFDIPSDGVLLAHQTPESIAEAILYLISNPEALLKMSSFGVEFMKSRSTINEASEFLVAIDSILSENFNKFDIQEILQQRFTGRAVIAAAYINSSVAQHVRSQFNKCINLTDESTFNDKTESVITSHSLVTTLSRASGYPALIDMSLLSKLKRLIKRFIKRMVGIEG